MDTVKLLEKVNNKKEELFLEISKDIVGQKDIIEHMFIALLCKGHILLEGVPGLGKTLIIKTLTKALDLKFNRIQFTPDLMPSDIIGTEILDQNSETGNRELKFIKGPIFSNIILADEINRTPPKTQSALLESMQERRVTTGGETYHLDNPFFVLATQNPIEQEGTYPLPEAQLDRFMFSLKIEYPSTEDEIAIVRGTTAKNQNTLNAIINKSDILSYQDLVRRVPVAENVIEYAVKLVSSTRPKSNLAPEFIQQSIEWGAGPRASQYLILGAKAKAILDGRPSPNINDVKSLALPILRHRVLPNFNAEAEGLKVEDFILKLIDKIEE